MKTIPLSQAIAILSAAAAIIHDDSAVTYANLFEPGEHDNDDVFLVIADDANFPEVEFKRTANGDVGLRDDNTLIFSDTEGELHYVTPLVRMTGLADIPAEPLRWFSVPCRITCEGETLEEGTVYARAATWGAAQDLAIRHVHDTWRCADQRLDYLVKNEHPEVQDETDPRFNRPESVFTDDGRTHPVS